MSTRQAGSFASALDAPAAISPHLTYFSIGNCCLLMSIAKPKNYAITITERHVHIPGCMLWAMSFRRIPSPLPINSLDRSAALCLK